MFAYHDHRFPLGAGPLESGLLQALRSDPRALRTCLDGYIQSRRADIDIESIHVRLEGQDEGFLELSFQETQWMACRLETGSQPHRIRLAYRLEEATLVVSSLPREAFEDRVDEL